MSDAVLSAFTNPVRLKIIACLAEQPKNVSELIGTCDLSQSAISQHLARLRQTGLVTTERHGKAIYYRISDPVAARLGHDLHTFITTYRQEVSA